MRPYLKYYVQFGAPQLQKKAWMHWRESSGKPTNRMFSRGLEPMRQRRG